MIFEFLNYEKCSLKEIEKPIYLEQAPFCLEHIF